MAEVRFCIDFGNTRKKLGCFYDDKLINEIILQDNPLEQILDLCNKHKPKSTILSSVINHDEEIENVLSANSKFLLLNPETKIPFLNAYSSPKTLGRDRVAMVAGLSKFYRNQNSLVISVGSCITYSFLAENNTLRGGAISPGIHQRFQALHEYTDKLPLVQKAGYDSLLGFDTETSIRSGVINGMASEIDGMIQRFEGEYGKINAVLTGGDTRFFARKLKSKIFADEFFLLKGLYAILEHNDA